MKIRKLEKKKKENFLQKKNSSAGILSLLPHRLGAKSGRLERRCGGGYKGAVGSVRVEGSSAYFYRKSPLFSVSGVFFFPYFIFLGFFFPCFSSLAVKSCAPTAIRRR